MRQHNVRRDGGFTLIELLTVVAIIAIVATLAIPNLLGAKLSTNESSAIATLRNLSSVQLHCFNRHFIDIDGDGSGEFGFFGELSGDLPPRNNVGVPLVPPLLASSFNTVNAGIVTRQGYNFIIYLPDVNGLGLPEVAGNYANVDPDNAENFWCCYAWPTDSQSSGRRVFFTNQTGEIVWTDNTVQNYTGNGGAPTPDACFDVAAAGTITGTPLTDGNAATDGGVWTILR